MSLQAIIKTNKGEIKLNLFPDVAPVTVLNFITLAKTSYYNGLKFHRVIEDFMIQGGDPTGTGAGGPGYQFGDEFKEGIVFNKKGLLAMANAGPNTNGSQFFITHVPTEWLNYKHTIFGEVVSEKERIEKASEPEYWEKSDFFEIEKTRTILRELMKYIDNPPRGIYTVDIIDELKDSEKKEGYNIQQR